MTEQQGNRVPPVLEYPFDFERYIAEQLREIDDLEERGFAKKVLLEGLGSIIARTEKSYRELEQRIYRETEVPESRYGIASTVIKREHYDPTNGTLFPVVPTDLWREEGTEALSAGEYLYAGTLFLEAGDDLCAEFEAEGDFTGTADGKETVFHICRAVRYRDAVERLYRIFLDNCVPWTTVNTGYLDKFYDIYVEQQGMQEENGDGYTAAALDIRFGRYGKMVHMDAIPLWNVEPVTFDSMNFMVPCIDGIHYEHEFATGGDRQEDGYLIQSREEILEIRHETDRIVLRTAKESFQKWTALRIVQGEFMHSLDYDMPLLSNRRKDSFIRRYAEGTGVRLLTKADLFRRIMETDTGDYIEAEDYEILDDGSEYPAQEGMNWFVRDELFPMDGRKVLLLKFRAKSMGHYLNGSMVRFVVSQIQMDVSEYRCVGILEEQDGTEGRQ